MKKELTISEIQSLLDYNPYTGEFIWKYRTDRSSSWNTRYANKIAGSISAGYVRIEINSKTYKAHHLAWLFATGNWPRMIDHHDGIGINNKILNLREATHAENNRNAKISSNNSSGIKGLSWRKNRGHWCARITVNNKVISLGSFHDKEKAFEVLNNARAKYHGEFARAS